MNYCRGLVEILKLPVVAHKVTDMFYPFLLYTGTDIDDNERFYFVRLIRSERERIRTAHRHPGEKETFEAECISKGINVFHHCLTGIVFVGCPVGISMPPLVEGHNVKVWSHSRGKQVPGMAGLSDPVKQY